MLGAIVATIQAIDTSAIVHPRWLPIQDGDDPAELRSELDADSVGRSRIHAWMVEQTSPLEHTLVGDVPFDDTSGEMQLGQLPRLSAIPRRLDCLWTYKIGLWYGYEQGSNTDNSTIRTGRILQQVVVGLSMRPKLGLGPHVQSHGELQTVRAYTRGFANAIAHVRLNILSVKLFQSIAPA